MQIYAHIEEQKLIGYYNTEVHSAIPSNAIEITEEQHQYALSINANAYVAGEFIVIYFRTAEEIFLSTKNDALQKVKNDFEAKVKQLVGDATSTEISSWKTQEEEAVQYLKDNTTPTPFVDALMRTRTDTKEELCNKVIYKANGYKKYYPLLLGEYHNALKKIESANSVEELN